MLEALGNLGDFIGGIAVVITLIYLALQVRQNTTALKASSWQEVVSGARQAAQLRGAADKAPAWHAGLALYPNMPDSDLVTFSAVITDEALFFQGVFALYKKGQLEASVYESYLNWFLCIVSTPGGHAWWEIAARPIFVPEMVEEVDREIEVRDVPDILQLPGMRDGETDES